MTENVYGEAAQGGPAEAPELEIIRGENIGQKFTLQPKTRLGRERDNDIVLIDPRISRYHSQIFQEAGQWLIKDLGSSNHTYVNGIPITEATPLRSSDRIGLGEMEFTIRLPARAADDTVTTKAASASPPVIVPPGATPAASEPAAARETAIFGGATDSPAAPPPGGPAPSPTAPGSGQSAVPRLAWIAGGLILVICLAAVSVVYFVASRPSAAEGVASTEASPAAVSSDVGDGQAPGVPSSGDLTLVYEDDFSDSFGGWDDAFDTYTRKVYGNNRYQIEVSTSNLVAWGLANRDVADFEVEVEARLEDGDDENTYGVLFRFQDRENFYRFDISGDGFFLLSKFVDGEWITLVDWTESPHINTGPGINNILKVTALGPEIAIWANGQQLASMTDDSLDRGNFGFFAGTFSEPYVWVSYDNLKLWVPEGREREIVLLPTATRPSTAPTDTPAPSPTPAPPTETPTPELELAEGEASAEFTPTPTPTPTTTPTPEPTATPEPLPEYASRDQTRARGQALETGRIIFPLYDPARETYDIYAADAADGANRALVQENASQPVLNLDGTELAYRSWQPDNRGLFARPLSGGDVWKFDPFFESARPAYSPVDDSLIFHSRAGGREPAVYRVINGIAEVMRREGFPIQGEAAKWSPDGQQFVYSSCLGGKCGIIRSNIEGGVNPVLLSDHPSDTSPEISPDGSTVVFMSNRGGNWEIYSVGIDGGPIEALTADAASDGLPTWSPEGDKIAFVSNRDGEWSIWDMDPDGSNERRLFALGGPVDGIVSHDRANSRGWVEENIDWIP